MFAQSESSVGGHVVGVMNANGDIDIVAQGLADPETGALVSEATVFHVASLSKQITAAALAKAILDGRLSLDDSVTDSMPELSHYGQDLTIAHLLYFTSGLTEAYSIPRPGNTPWSTHYYFTVDQAIQASATVPELRFEPGTVWEYNNINFQLIAELLERTYGQDFSELVDEWIFSPLGMEASLINDDITVAVRNRAVGVVPRIAPVIEQLRLTGVEAGPDGGPIIIRRNAPHYGGSGVLTSMDDWMKWQEEMLSREVFGDDFWDLMLSTREFEHDKSNDAFGLVHGRYQGVATLWFAGSDIDGSSYMVASPEGNIAAACFSNNPLFNCQEAALRAFTTELD
ncbi:MAG: serine hydrolase domain-containing protein [Pseudomonadota bacterium]